MSESDWWYVTFSPRSEELRLYKLVRNLTMSNSTIKASSSIHLVAEQFIFDVMIGVSERGSQDVSNGTNFASYLAKLFSDIARIAYGGNSDQNCHKTGKKGILSVKIQHVYEP
jgi:hypothetical protein